MTATTAPTTSRPGRRLGARTCLALPALVVAAFGGQLLVTGWLDDRAAGSMHVQDVAWGATEGVLLLVPLVVLLRRAHSAASLQALAVVGALVLTMALTAFDPFTAVLGVLVVAGVTLTRAPLRPGGAHRGLAGMAAVAGCALVPYAVHAAAQQRTGGTEAAELLGPTGAAAWALSLVTVAVVAALRPAGWRVPAFSVAAAAAAVGAASLVWPSVPSSLGTVGGALAVAWAAVVAAVAARSRD